LITHNGGLPSSWVKRFLPLIRGSGRVIDLACGDGRHTQLLLSFGHQVLALDKNEHSLSVLKSRFHATDLKNIEVKTIDLETDIFALQETQERFSGLVVTNYLYRPHLGEWINLIQPGGVVIYETFAVGNEVYGKPSNPNFLLNQNELIGFFSISLGWSIVCFEQGKIDNPKPAVIQRICAVRSPAIGLQLLDE